MKTSNLWKTLTAEQRRVWNAWAKNNPVLLDDGNTRIVSGRKAMTMVLRNRAVAGEAANPAVVPVAVSWLAGQVFSLRDAGPFTVNTGYMGLRAEQPVPAGTKWFVWATPPLASESISPGLLRLVTCLTLAAPLAFDDVVTSFAAAYRSVCGDWRGPGLDGAWPVATNILFRVHQYANGQIGPRTVMMNGRVQVQL
jgi:hypothetical protein